MKIWGIMEKQNIFDLSKEELSEVIKPSFRELKAIYQWLYQKNMYFIWWMKNLPKELEQLNANYYLDPLSIVKVEESRDGTKKYLFSLKDGNTVESVLPSYMKQEVLN